MGVDIFVPLVLRDTRDVLLSLVRDTQEQSLVLPREDMFTIYKKIKEIRDLYTRITRKSTPLQTCADDREIGFDSAKTIFGGAIAEWLEATDTSTVEWIDRAVHGDAFKVENDDMKQSSSIMDLFQIIGGAVEFLRNLEWPDELQYAQYATRLASVLSPFILVLTSDHRQSDWTLLYVDGEGVCRGNECPGGFIESTGWSTRLDGPYSWCNRWRRKGRTVPL
jgi:hypothetical protein